jgi:hypothetical protein
MSSLFFVLRKSMASAICSDECGTELRYSVQHLEFSSESVSRCSDMDMPALELKANVISLIVGRP